jgi:hypothetical protein
MKKSLVKNYYYQLGWWGWKEESTSKELLTQWKQTIKKKKIK